jgi:uncharacterized membrane protein
MLHNIKLFILSMLVFFILDMAWLGYFAKDLYFKNYGAWLRLADGELLPVWWAVAIVYLLFAFATLTFVLPLAKGHLSLAFIYGASLGLIIYGVYDFTCLGLFKNWPLMMAFIDWAWGTVLCGVSATITAYISRFI